MADTNTSEATGIPNDIRGRVRCVVVTPERAVFDRVVDMVIVPMFDGEFGVLPGRAPVIGRLGSGELRLNDGDRVERWFVEAGFVQVRANVVTVLTSKALAAAAVTTAMADAAAREAESLPSGNAVERANKAKARDRAQGLKKVAGKSAAGSHATA